MIKEILSFTKKLLKLVSKYHNFSISISLNNQRLVIPIIQNVGLSLLKLRNHEKFMSKILEKYYDNNGAFIDVGTNIGQTLTKFKTIFPKSQYIGIEANPNCASYVNKLIEKNKFKNCIIISAGITHSPQILPLLANSNDSSIHDPNATLVEKYRESNKFTSSIYSYCTTLDHIIDSLKIKVSFIKIDIEGGELFALMGMKKTLKHQRPKIILEILPQAGKKIKFRSELTKKINRILENYNYVAFNIEELNYNYKLKKLKKIPENKKDLSNFNYLLIPN